MGGDCSLLLGVFAFLRAEVGTVGLWTLDGHPDHLDAPGSETGETAELARLPDDVFAIDAPTVLDDPRDAGARAAEWAERLGLPMWLHLDVDVLDPSVMPAVTYPQAGGPDLDQLTAVLAPLGASPALVGASVADLRPDLDDGDVHARQLVTLLDRTLRDPTLLRPATLRPATTTRLWAVDARGLLTRLCETIEAQAWDELSPLLHDDFTCRYVHTGEKFDRESWVRVNAEYPGFAHLVVEDLVADGDRAVARCHVTGYVDGQLAHFEVATFVSAKDGRILDMTEVWTDVDQAPPEGTRP